MALVHIFGWDNGQGNPMDSACDTVSDRGSIGTSVEQGRTFADGLVPADFSRLAINSGFRVNLALWNIAPTDEILLALWLAPMRNPFGGPDALWHGDFLEAGFGNLVPPNVGVTLADLNRVVIASLDDTTGAIRFYQGRTGDNFDWISWGGPSTFLAQTAPGTIVPGEPLAFYTFRFNRTTDTIEVAKNGTVILNQSGVGMGAGVFNRIGRSLNQFAINEGTRTDDFYAMTLAGGVWTVPIANPRVVTMMPTADAAPNAWTPNPVVPGNFQNVADLDRIFPYQQNVYDQDLTYVESAVAAQRESYFVTPPAIPSAIIYGVQFHAYFRAMGGFDATVSLVATSPGGVDYVYGPFVILSGYVMPGDAAVIYQGARSPLLEQDPETGANWTDARLALWKFGFQNMGGTQVRCTQIAVAKLCAAPAPAPAGVGAAVAGVGGAKPPVTFRAGCGSPPNAADRLLRCRARTMWEANRRAVCEYSPPPYREMLRDGDRFQQINTIALPVAENVDNLVLSWTVPTGYDGVVTTLSNFYNGPGYVNGSGDLIWRWMVDGHWLEDLQAVDIAIGRPSMPYKLAGAGYRVKTHQLVRAFVSLGTGALGRLGPGGRIVCAAFGWTYPRQSRYGGRRG